MKQSLLAFSILAVTAGATAPALASELPFYLSVDLGGTLSVSDKGFEGYCSDDNCATSTSSSGIGSQLGLGWVVTPRVSFEVNYFKDADISERIPEGGRSIALGEDDEADEGVDLPLVNAFTAKPSGFGLRVRYFIPLTERIDLAIGSGWQRTEIKYEGSAADTIKNSNLQHSVGLSYAASRNLVWRIEYHYKQDYFTTNGFDYSTAKIVNAGFEYHF